MSLYFESTRTKKTTMPVTAHSIPLYRKYKINHMCELPIRGRYENESNPRMQLIEPKWSVENLKKFKWESNPELCVDRTEHSTHLS